MNVWYPQSGFKRVIEMGLDEAWMEVEREAGLGIFRAWLPMREVYGVTVDRARQDPCERCPGSLQIPLLIESSV